MNRKKLFILILIIAIIAIIAIITTVMFKLFKNNAAKKHAALIEYSYTYGGDMNGSFTSITVRKTDDGKAFVVKTHSDWHSQDPAVSEYYVDASLLAEIEKIYDEYKIYKYPDLPDSEYFALDAGTGSYHFGFEDMQSTRFSDYKDIPIKGYDGLRAIDELIDKAVEQGEKLPGLVVDIVSEEDFNPNIIEEGVFKLSVYEYCDNYLYYRFLNGLSEEVDITYNATIYRVNDTEREEVYKYSSDYESSIPEYYNDENSFELEGIRLSEGKYVLVVSGYEAEFEIR